MSNSVKIVSFIGSPRKNGNTANLTNKILKGAESKGAKIKNFYLNEMNIKGCQGCMYCRTNELCALKDDMSEIYKEIKEADVLVIASPIYMWQVSGQTKIFIDRLFALLKTEGDNYDHYGCKYGEKKVVMVYTQGQPEEKVFQNYIEHNEKMLGLFKMDVIKNIVSGGNAGMNDVLNDDKNMKEAFKLGEMLANLN